MQRGAGGEGREGFVRTALRFQNITKTFMHEGITKYRRCYVILIYTYCIKMMDYVDHWQP